MTSTAREDVDDPHRLARAFLREMFNHPERSTLVYWRGEWFAWDDALWSPVPSDEIRSRLNGFVKREFDRANAEEVEAHSPASRKPVPAVRKVTRSLVGNCLDALASMTTIGSRIEQPSWIGEEDSPFDVRRVIATPKQILDLNALIEGRTGHAIPQTPDFFSSSRLGCEYDPRAGEPTEWLSFLGSIWPEDPDAISTLRTWFGYCLTADTSQQRILFLVGPKRSGKGTIARVLRALLGGDRVVAGPTLGSLASPFGLWGLIGKPLAIISDARLSGRSDQAVVVERLLSISGEDSLTVDRKNLPPVEARLPTRIVICSNELPRLNDSSGALASRLLVLVMRQSFYGCEDVHLEAKLLSEMTGILNWSITGAKWLRDIGHFVQPESGREAIEAIEDLGSPVAAFLRERCEVRAGASCFAEDLFDAWKDWCKESGREHAGTVQVFSRDLHAVVACLKVTNRRTGNGQRKRRFEGIGIIPSEESRNAVERGFGGWDQ